MTWDDHGLNMSRATFIEAGLIGSEIAGYVGIQLEESNPLTFTMEAFVIEAIQVVSSLGLSRRIVVGTTSWTTNAVGGGLAITG